MPARAPVDVHAHFYPQAFLDLVAAHGPAHGVEWREIPGKGPQFRIGHLATGPLGPRYSDLDARLAAMDEQGVAVHALADPALEWRVASRDAGRYAHDLYACLREFDALARDLILVEQPPADEAWRAVGDRLQRAAADSK